MAADLAASGERRAYVRFSPSRAATPIACRIRPGHLTEVVNLSDAGALLDTRRRLTPGGSVDLQWEHGTTRLSVRAQVLRCSVVLVTADTITYRGAVRFDRTCAWDQADRSPEHPAAQSMHRGAISTRPDAGAKCPIDRNR